MNKVLVTVDIILILLLLLFALVVFLTKRNLNLCINTESASCLTLTCPTTGAAKGPCFGYAMRKGDKEGTYYCSAVPEQLVNQNGQPV